MDYIPTITPEGEREIARLLAAQEKLVFSHYALYSRDGTEMERIPIVEASTMGKNWFLVMGYTDSEKAYEFFEVRILSENNTTIATIKRNDKPLGLKLENQPYEIRYQIFFESFSAENIEIVETNYTQNVNYIEEFVTLSTEVLKLRQIVALQQTQIEELRQIVGAS